MTRQNVTLCYSNLSTGMARAVFAEVAERLETLAHSGEASVIDLRSLPLTDTDLEELEQLLGQGEVQAEIEVIGHTRVRETAFAGVWWLRHMGAHDRIAVEQIAITPMPDILFAQPEDIAGSANRIRKQVENQVPKGPDEEAADG